MIGLASRGHPDADGARAGFEPVADGVFDEGLEQEGGDEAIEGVRVEIGFELEPVPEAELLNVAVEFEEAHLLAQRGFLLGGLAEGKPEEVAEGDEHFLGGAGVLTEQGGDGIECVEEKMGLELGLEGVEAGPGEVGFERDGPPFAFAKAALEEDRVRGSNEGGTGEEIEKERRRRGPAEDVGERPRFAGVPHLEAEAGRDVGRRLMRDNPDFAREGADGAAVGR